ncbi:TPA: LexA family transcriptional regulator [Vibrio harveyi]
MVRKSVGCKNESLNAENNEKGIIQKSQIIPFKERLKDAIGDMSLRAFAKECDLSPSTVSNYLNGSTYPTLDRLAVMAEVASASYSWLATGEVNASDSKMKNSVEIFQYDLSASAGPGCMIVSEEPVAKFEFSKEWLIRQGLNGKKLTVVPVHGDSMEPTLMDEDLMLVELIDDPRQARDGVCVFRIDDDVMVKRVQYDFTRSGYRMTSDNTVYEPFFIGEEFAGRFVLLGRMVRVLQRAKR